MVESESNRIVNVVKLEPFRPFSINRCSNQKEKSYVLRSSGIETNKRTLLQNLEREGEKRERPLLLFRSDLCVTEVTERRKRRKRLKWVKAELFFLVFRWHVEFRGKQNKLVRSGKNRKRQEIMLGPEVSFDGHLSTTLIDYSDMGCKEMRQKMKLKKN